MYQQIEKRIEEQPTSEASVVRKRTGKQGGNSASLSILVVCTALLCIVLIGFGIYLAGVLGIFDAPWRQNHSAPHDPAAQTIVVPSLIGKDYDEAQRTAASLGCNLKITSGSPTGRVVQQTPEPYSRVPFGTTVNVVLE